MKIKIISEGNGKNTKVVNADTGEAIENVLSCTWTCDGHDPATATLRIFQVAIEATVDDAEVLAVVLPRD